MNERDEMLLSQLADGELTSDEANTLLLKVLEDSTAREYLAGMLQVRQRTLPWRSCQPEQSLVVLGQSRNDGMPPRRTWRLAGFATAACIGGVLALAGFWSAVRLGVLTPLVREGVPTQVVDLGTVTPEQMQQVAKVFALHESVAGPLAWYAADDQKIRLASASGTEVTQIPIGVLIKLESTTPGAVARTLVIVCRNDQSAIIEIPAESGQRTGLRVCLTPRTSNGKVDVQYAIAMDGPAQQAPLASLSGQRRLGLAESPLGQLAMGDRVMNIEAAAWPMRQER